MSCLFRLILVLIAVHITLIGTVHLTSRDQRPIILDLFTNPDGTPCQRPCLFGVRPGKMTVEVAKSQIRKHWLLSNVESITTDAFGTIFMAEAKGEFAGNRFRIWLLPDSRVPTMTASLVFGIMTPNQVMASDFTIPITTSGTFITLFGQPDHRVAYVQPNNSREFAFPEQGLRAYIVPSALLGKSATSNVSHPTPNDVVLSFQVAEPFVEPYRWPFSLAWCGFTWRDCQPGELPPVIR